MVTCMEMRSAENLALLNMKKVKTEDPENIPSKDGYPVGVTIEPKIFRGKYQRNNKRGGLKNLRCFPTCGELHRARGFCGRSVIIKFHKRHNKWASLDWDSVVCVGEFTPVQGINRFRKNETVLKAYLHGLERTSNLPMLPLMFGERIYSSDSALVEYEFNRKKKGWHYGWSSNKHSCNTEHCFRIYILKALNSSEYELIEVVDSPSFVLFCRRRRRFHMEPSAPLETPGLKKRRKTSGRTIKLDSKNLRSGQQNRTMDINAIAHSLVSFASICNQVGMLQKEGTVA